MLSNVSRHLFLAAMCVPLTALAQTPQPIDPTLARIRDEGLNRSQVPATLTYLCDVIGQRLTGSPSQQKASEWTRDTLAKWGLSNAHLEEWGPFGRGWMLEKYSLQVTEPYTIEPIGSPLAWSPGLDQPIDAPVVYLDARNSAGLAKYAGILKGKIVLLGVTRTLEPHFDPQATRMDADRLSKLANATLGKTTAELMRAATAPTTAPATSRPVTMDSAQLTTAANFNAKAIAFAQREGAALIIQPSSIGDGGTFLATSATVPAVDSASATTSVAAIPQATTAAAAGAPASLAVSVVAPPTTRPRAWSTAAPPLLPQVVVTIEDFNRLVTMLKNGVELKMAAELRVKFFDHPQTTDTIAELPGADLADQVVMIGGHLDSWASGTGATDNGAGAVTSMEAVRILKALDLHPRRTIRVALWTGEEEGLLGSTAYVKQHFGDWDSVPPGPPRINRHGPRPTTMVSVLNKTPEYKTLSVYFNLDNGAGKIRGLYAQSSPAAAEIFKQWLAPVADLDAGTVTLANTGSTDHIAFDRIGLPGFQFIQDPLEYRTRTHHTNEDVIDRVPMDDVKQAATVMAVCLWEAANAPEQFPRKALVPPTTLPSR